MIGCVSVVVDLEVKGVWDTPRVHIPLSFPVVFQIPCPLTHGRYDNKETGSLFLAGTSQTVPLRSTHNQLLLARVCRRVTVVKQFQSPVRGCRANFPRHLISSYYIYPL